MKVTGCVSVTSTESSLSFNITLKMRQAQKVVEIEAKHTNDLLKEEFEAWMESIYTIGRNPVLFQFFVSF